MINKDRIIPIQRTDYLSLISTIVACVGYSQVMNLDKLDYVMAKNVEGDFELPAGESGTAYILTEPAKSIDVTDITAGAAYFFVPAYNFEGFSAEVDGAQKIVKDGVSMFVITNDGTDTAVRLITPQL